MGWVETYKSYESRPPKSVIAAENKEQKPCFPCGANLQ